MEENREGQKPEATIRSGKVSFESDYIAGAHPEILRRLTEINPGPISGYGTDSYCESARRKILEACGLENGQVEFLVGGTQANAVVISTMLADYEGVLAVRSGHVSTHEAGAIEYTGHEVLELPQKNGKMQPEVLRQYLRDFHADANHEHMTFPGMVYLSWPTEYGTLYTKAEMEAISGICREYGIPLCLDGARLGYGLMSREADLTAREIAKLCDVFYIGGTKAGALCGEAVVFTRGNRPKHFMTSVKKRGALLAKGWLLGVQFDTLFTEDLYFRISRHAIDMAERMKALFLAYGLRIYMASPTNQQFVLLSNSQMKALEKQVAFSFWEKYDEDHTVVRFATSWSTTEEDLAALDRALGSIRRRPDRPSDGRCGMTILVDMDDTIEQLLKSWVARANEKFGRNVTLDEITDWNVAVPYTGISKKDIYNVTCEPGFWKTVEPMPGAADALRHFLHEGHEVYIVTATEPEHVDEKMNGLLFRYFPFLSWNQVIITSRKQMIRGDVLIDDGVHNLEGGAYQKILFSAPHNRGYDAEANGMIRVHTWDEVVEIIDRMAREKQVDADGRAGERPCAAGMG